MKSVRIATSIVAGVARMRQFRAIPACASGAAPDSQACPVRRVMIEVNQQLIAERLRISRATVSRCFTNHPGINPVTRARVFQMAAEIGYAHLEKRTTNTKKK